MKLREEQSLFVKLIGKLLVWATCTPEEVEELLAMMKARAQRGGKPVELTFGDAYRDPRATFPYGHSESLHKKKLAIDLNLFRDGQYLTSTDDHLLLARFWKLLHPNCTWGGDFLDPATGDPRPDGNHYSFGEQRRAL